MELGGGGMVQRPFVGISVFILSFALVGSASSVFPEDQMNNLRVNSQRLGQRIVALAEFGKNANGGLDRVAFSETDIQGRKFLISLMKEAGLDVRVDEAGNIIGRREGLSSKSPPIMFGSHSDTVPDGGRYDGALGVLGAIECAQVLYENDIITQHPFEVIVFTDEEGGLVGSRAMTGTLTPDALNVVSHSGKTVRQGIIDLGGNPEKLDRVVRKEGDIKAFIEIHIEQGKILETKNIDIGVVEGIVGISWWDVTIEGFSNHAGTTPMDMRQDALLAASFLVIAVNRVVTSVPGSQVGTVGRIKAEPGAPNVIPGKVVMSLELRDLSGDKIQSLYETINKEAQNIAEKTGTKISFSSIDAMAIPAPTDTRIRKYIDKSAKELGLTTLFMPSGAGHDAQDMAKIAPTGMIFIPSVGGISHSPKEFSRPDDITNGVNVLLHTILKIDSNALE
jgi:N-carbamoyl-L-amino-acid hydrolase